jgi:hypothetical protein
MAGEINVVHVCVLTAAAAAAEIGNMEDDDVKHIHTAIIISHNIQGNNRQTRAGTCVRTKKK